MLRPTVQFFLFCIALLAQPFICNGWQEEQVVYDSVLLVNDPHARGTLGDDFLSLSEAIRLANGSLPLDALGQQEADCVSGLPGQMSADHIKVLLGNGAVIQAEDPAFPGEPVFPVLIGNDKDCFEGGGVIIMGSSEGGPSDRTAMIIMSSYVRVRSFEFWGLRAGIIVTSDFFPGVTGVTIERNGFEDIQFGIHAIASTWNAGAIRELSIKRNRFSCLQENAISIFVQGAAPQNEGQEIFGAVVEELTIKGNRINGGLEGIFIAGGVAQFGTRVGEVSLRDIVVKNNRIKNVYDVSIAVAAGMTNGGGHAENVTVEDVSVKSNRIEVRDSPGTPIWAVAGATTFEGPGGGTSGNVFRRLNIVANSINGKKSDCAGINISSGHVELADGDGYASENELSDVLVHANRVCACENGITIMGGVAAASAGIVEENLVRRVTVTGNWFMQNNQGVNIISGIGAESTAMTTPYIPAPAYVTDNHVEEILIEQNRLYRNEIGLNFLGGASVDSPDIVTLNRVESVSIGRNKLKQNEYDCLVTDNFVLGDEGGEASDNAAVVTCE